MITFADLNLDPDIVSTVGELGYEQPTPVQQESIPILLEGHDLLAQAQTGTGKTAAFALPILSKIDLSIDAPQALILAPTRELAIQLAEAFQACAKKLKGFHVLPIYGGQDYRSQLKALKRGVHIVVGTPGRVMDHMRRGTLDLSKIRTLVLDEADEMLRMGFIEDVQWILSQIPGEHQTALFSATMPGPIRKVVSEYLKDPKKVHIQSKARTIDTVEQQYMIVSQHHKLEALTRFLELEDRDGIIVFTRTKTGTTQLAEKLEARGYAVAALNGDMKQSQREQVIDRIKRGTLDLVIATEVAARGLDVERISHVVNYDIPHDAESYIHRIGRTGRAGRTGKALLLVTPRERRMLRDIEHTINMPITPVPAPSLEQVNQLRGEKFTQKIIAALENPQIEDYREIVQGLCHGHEVGATDIAAALYSMSQPLLQVDGDQTIGSEFEQEAPRRGKKGKGGKPNGRRSGAKSERDHDFSENRGRKKPWESGHGEKPKRKSFKRDDQEGRRSSWRDESDNSGFRKKSWKGDASDDTGFRKKSWKGDASEDTGFRKKSWKGDASEDTGFRKKSWKGDASEDSGFRKKTWKSDASDASDDKGFRKKSWKNDSSENASDRKKPWKKDFSDNTGDRKKPWKKEFSDNTGNRTKSWKKETNDHANKGERKKSWGDELFEKNAKDKKPKDSKRLTKKKVAAKAKKVVKKKLKKAALTS